MYQLEVIEFSSRRLFVTLCSGSTGAQYEMLDLLACFKRGECNGIKVKLGRLQSMIDTSVIEPLEFINLEQDRTRLVSCLLFSPHLPRHQ